MNPSLYELSKSPERIHPLILAYMGDAIYEVYIRQYLIARGISHPQKLQQEAVKYVSATAQAKIIFQIIDQLTDEERAILKRGRNAKSGSSPKNAKITDYRYSTGLEALIGYLYLSKKEERLQELMQLIIGKVSKEVR